jgi:hypothetical protein
MPTYKMLISKAITEAFDITLIKLIIYNKLYKNIYLLLLYLAVNTLLKT